MALGPIITSPKLKNNQLQEFSAMIQDFVTSAKVST